MRKYQILKVEKRDSWHILESRKLDKWRILESQKKCDRILQNQIYKCATESKNVRQNL